ncbi:MAG: zinc transporter ZupT [Firmicutes bacterium]|nr:zinc transporter ZupT [Bacillota bacterium]
MPFDKTNLLFAFGLTLFAGLSTGIGSLVALYTEKPNRKFLSVVLGFSAGVMIYVSMIEIFAEARISLEAIYGSPQGYWATTIAFFAGIALIALIDRFVPSPDNPHEIHKTSEETGIGNGDPALLRLGLFSALAITIHNFPEGIATFASAVKEMSLGITIAVAVAIHNIPEGIAVSVPVYYATGSRKKALFYSFLSGFSEPLGAALGYFLFRIFIINEAMFGWVFAGVAGIMVYISLDELLPTAEKYGEHHWAICGLVLGMMVMAASLLLFA